MDEFESVYVQDELDDSLKGPCGMDRLKIGEIYQIRQNQYVFVCLHCSKEFQQFSRLTTHVQTHFQAAFQWMSTNKITESFAESTTNEADVTDDEEWLVSDTSQNSNFDDGSEVNPIGDFGCVTELHEGDGNLLKDNIHPLGNSPSRTLEKEFKLKHPLLRVKDNEESRQLLKYFRRDYHFKQTPDHRFMCPLCDVRGVSKTSIREHIFTHVKSNIFNCKLCSSDFNRFRQFREHVEQQHCTVEPLSPDNSTPQKRIKIEQMDTMGNINKSNIIVSTEVQMDADEMIRSLEGINDKDRLRCAVCFKTFSKANGIVKHMKVHSQDRKHQCFECGAQFIRSDHLNRHMLCHEEPKFKCDICNVAFRRSDKLLAHRRRHAEPMKFTCENCGLGFMELTSIKTHIGFHCKVKREGGGSATTTQLSITNPGEMAKI